MAERRGGGGAHGGAFGGSRLDCGRGMFGRRPRRHGRCRRHDGRARRHAARWTDLVDDDRLRADGVVERLGHPRAETGVAAAVVDDDRSMRPRRPREPLVLHAHLSLPSSARSLASRRAAAAGSFRSASFSTRSRSASARSRLSTGARRHAAQAARETDVNSSPPGEIKQIGFASVLRTWSRLLVGAASPATRRAGCPVGTPRRPAALADGRGAPRGRRPPRPGTPSTAVRRPQVPAPPQRRPVSCGSARVGAPAPAPARAGGGFACGLEGGRGRAGDRPELGAAGGGVAVVVAVFPTPLGRET